MASKSVTARPAARKGQATSKPTKTIAKKAAPKAKPVVRSRLEPIVQTVDRATKPVIELPKLTGALPVPTATFYF
jgi:hypothetical protein